MSKSDTDYRSRIELLDPPELVAEKLKKAVTDSRSAVSYEPEQRPGVSNLIEIHSACTDRLPEDIVESCTLQALNTGLYKKEVAAALSTMLAPIQKEYFKIIKDRVYLDKVLKDGAQRANEIASRNFEQIREAIGFKF